MNRTSSGLYVARSVPAFLRFRARTRTVTLPNGERAKVTIDDSGTVRHVEHGDHLDATVRPNTIRMVLRPQTAGPTVGGFRQPPHHPNTRSATKLEEKRWVRQMTSGPGTTRRSRWPSSRTS